MISIQLNLRNPWSDRWNIIKSWAGKTPFKNKFWEFQTNRTNDIVSFDFRFSIRQDHAGVFFSIGFIGYEIIANLYDDRHWDNDNNCWHVYSSKKDLL